jgi:hypothetical protein
MLQNRYVLISARLTLCVVYLALMYGLVNLQSGCSSMVSLGCQ